LEDISDAQDCIQSCDILKFDACLDVFTDADNKSRKKIEELVECCGLDNKCEKTLETAQDCIGVCIDGCLQDAGTAYTECLGDEKKCSKGGCAAALSDVDDPASGDAEKTVSKLKPEDLQDCEDVGKFYKEVCKTGKDCCKDCNPELADVLDCMINDIVIPYLAVELNTTIGECPPSTTNASIEDAETSTSSRCPWACPRWLITHNRSVVSSQRLLKSVIRNLIAI
jgi:hypothetical protein